MIVEPVEVPADGPERDQGNRVAAARQHDAQIVQAPEQALRDASGGFHGETLVPQRRSSITYGLGPVVVGPFGPRVHRDADLDRPGSRAGAFGDTRRAAPC